MHPLAIDRIYGIPTMHKSCPDGSDACHVGDPGSIPGIGKIPWRREWQPTPAFLPGESLWTEEPGGLTFMGLQRLGWTRLSD